MASSVSVREPIWFTLTRIEFATPWSMPLRRNFTLVTNRSSPTSWILSPSFSVCWFPFLPVVSRASVFDADDGIFIREFGIEFHQLLAGQLAASALLKNIAAAFC